MSELHVKTMAEYMAEGKEVDILLQKRGARRVNFKEWQKISDMEYSRAQPPRPRERFTRVEEMLAILD